MKAHLGLGVCESLNEATDELPGAWAAPAPGRVAGSGRGRGACIEFLAYISQPRISIVSDARALLALFPSCKLLKFRVAPTDAGKPLATSLVLRHMPAASEDSACASVPRPA